MAVETSFPNSAIIDMRDTSRLTTLLLIKVNLICSLLVEDANLMFFTMIKRLKNAV